MTRKKITLQVINSNQIFLEIETKAILLNGIEGDFMILPNHERLLALINTGIVRVGSDSNKLKDLLITSSGTLEVENNICKLFVQRVMLIEDVKSNLSSITKELKGLEKELDHYVKTRWEDPFLLEKINFFKKVILFAETEQS